MGCCSSSSVIILYEAHTKIVYGIFTSSRKAAAAESKLQSAADRERVHTAITRSEVRTIGSLITTTIPINEAWLSFDKPVSIVNHIQQNERRDDLMRRCEKLGVNESPR